MVLIFQKINIFKEYYFKLKLVFFFIFVQDLEKFLIYKYKLYYFNGVNERYLES